MTLEAVHFDLDFTLADTAAPVVAYFTYAFAACGIPLPAKAAVERTVGLPLSTAFASLAPGCDPEPLCQAFHAKADEIMVRGTEFSGLIAACARLEAVFADALYAGDSLVDAEAAARCGLPFVAVLHGRTGAAEFADFPCLGVYRDLRPLPDLARTLRAGEPFPVMNTEAQEEAGYGSAHSLGRRTPHPPRWGDVAGLADARAWRRTSRSLEPDASRGGRGGPPRLCRGGFPHRLHQYRGRQ